MSYTKSYQILHKKRVSLLTSLKVSTLVCKCVFYRSEHNAEQDLVELDFELFEIQK